MTSYDDDYLFRWGVARGYCDVHGEWHESPQASLDAVFGQLGGVNGSVPGPDAAGALTARDLPLVLRSTASVSDGGRRWAERHQPNGQTWQIRFEDGVVVTGAGDLPSDLPLGYHELTWQQGPQAQTRPSQRLIVAPHSCPSPSGQRFWGWALQLYALRSRRSWGIGDLGDLRRFAGAAREKGADFALLNPLHAPLFGAPQQTSPYFPSSREFRNPLYIDVSAVVQRLGLSDNETVAAQLAVGEKAGEICNSSRLIDRDAIFQAKMQTLEEIWSVVRQQRLADFDAWRSSRGSSLERYATFCVLSEMHGRPWASWPEALRSPENQAVARIATENADRVRFHAWLQWLVDDQLKVANDTLGLMHDLAIGVDPAGADTWLWQEAFALNMRVGAPPDEFNTRGQDWGLPPLDPWRLRAFDYEPFIHTVRAGLSHAKGLRIDHVMGLFRLFWIPDEATPREGVYVHYPAEDMLAIVALESVRAGGYVVGEDLGTVEDYMREALDRHNVLSYRLLWFEDKPPSEYPQRALAAITTHDLPTVRGLWDESDLARQHELGMQPNEEGTHAIRNKVREWMDLSDDSEIATVISRAHELLAKAQSSMVTATVEDAMAVADRPNFPGTTDEWPNWSVPLPEALEDFVSGEAFGELSRVMSERHQDPSIGDSPEAS